MAETRLMRSLLLTWRMQRWELSVLIGGSILLAAAAGFVAWQMTVTLEGLELCYAGASVDPLSAECRSLVDRGNVWTALSPMLQGATTVVPFVVGILLGAPLVSREIEKRTAPIAWSLSPSRARWLARRTLPLLISVALALLLLGQATEALILATPPGDIGFAHLAMHGPLVAVRGIAAFAVGVVIGLAVGRMLPAILVSGLVAIAMLIGLQLVRSEQMRTEAVWLDAADNNFLSGVVVYDSAFTDDASGEFVTFEEASDRFPGVFGMQGSGMPPGMSQVYLATPPELYPVFVAREMAALLVATALAAGVALWLIRSRRPA